MFNFGKVYAGNCKEVDYAATTHSHYITLEDLISVKGVRDSLSRFYSGEELEKEIEKALKPYEKQVKDWNSNVVEDSNDYSFDVDEEDSSTEEVDENINNEEDIVSSIIDNLVNRVFSNPSNLEKIEKMFGKKIPKEVNDELLSLASEKEDSEEQQPEEETSVEEPEKATETVEEPEEETSTEEKKGDDKKEKLAENIKKQARFKKDKSLLNKALDFIENQVEDEFFKKYSSLKKQSDYIYKVMTAVD